MSAYERGYSDGQETRAFNNLGLSSLDAQLYSAGYLSARFQIVEPPKLAQFIILGLLPGNCRDVLFGDLQELYSRITYIKGSKLALLWYYMQVFGVVRITFIDMCQTLFLRLTELPLSKPPDVAQVPPADGVSRIP